MRRATLLLSLIGLVATGCGRTPIIDNNKDRQNGLTDDTGDLPQLTVERYGSSSSCESSAAELTLNVEVVTLDDGSRSLVFRADGAPLSSAHAMLVVSTQPDYEDGIIYNVDPHVDLCLDEGEGLIAPSDATADDVSDAIADQAPWCVAVSLPFAYATATPGIPVDADGDGIADTDADGDGVVDIDADGDADAADGDAPPDGTEPPPLACVDGDVFPAGDGCNTCTCVDGLALCTEMACPDLCVDGETRMEDCNECVCLDGDWACTDMACEVCVDGETTFDGCNECVCADGDWLCTDMACPEYGTPEIAIPYGAGHAYVQMFILCNDHILFEDGPYVEPIFAATDALEVTAR